MLRVAYAIDGMVADIGTVAAIAAIVWIFLAGAAYTASEIIEERRRERGAKRGKLPLILAAPLVPVALVLGGVLGIVALYAAVVAGRNLLTGISSGFVLLCLVAAVAYWIGKDAGRSE